MRWLREKRGGWLRAGGAVLLRACLVLVLAACLPAACIAMQPAHQDYAESIRDDAIETAVQRAGDAARGDLAEIRRTGVLRVLVAYAKGDFFIADGEARGVEADLARAFAAWLGRKRGRHTPPVRAIFIPVPFERLLDELEAGRGDIAAAGLTVTPSRAARVPFGTPYVRNVDEVVVGRKGAPAPAGLAGLSGRVVHAMAGSSQEEHLRALDVRLRAEGKPGITITLPPEGLGKENLFAMLNAGAIDLIAADRHRAELWAAVLPNLRILNGMVLRSGNNIAWAVRPGCPELLAAVNGYFAASGKAALARASQLLAEYFRNPEWRVNPLGSRFKNRVDALWPHFSLYADQYGYDPLLLVAQGFRESRLRQSARSPRGAVGIMQVLPETAAELGVPDVATSAGENIRAGVLYMHTLREGYFSNADIREPDRTLFVLAAYNMGPNRLTRVREKAAAMGLDPNRWYGNVEFAALRYVGQEPVRYVALISSYYLTYKGAARQVLKRRAVANRPVLPESPTPIPSEVSGGEARQAEPAGP